MSEIEPKPVAYVEGPNNVGQPYCHIVRECDVAPFRGQKLYCQRDLEDLQSQLAASREVIRQLQSIRSVHARSESALQQQIGELDGMMRSLFGLSDSERILRVKPGPHPSIVVLSPGGTERHCMLVDTIELELESKIADLTAKLEAVVTAAEQIGRLLTWDCLDPTPRVDLCADLGWLKTELTNIHNQLTAAIDAARG